MEQVTPRSTAVAQDTVPASAHTRGRVSNPRPVGEDDVRRICVAAY